jgi:hypothetical protein
MYFSQYSVQYSVDKEKVPFQTASWPIKTLPSTLAAAQKVLSLSACSSLIHCKVTSSLYLPG